MKNFEILNYIKNPGIFSFKNLSDKYEKAAIVWCDTISVR